MPQLIQDQAIMMGSQQLPGLSAREYYCYLLTAKHRVDEQNWSVLVKDLDTKTRLVPCVRSIAGRYNFSSDHAASLLGANSFRPALEIS